MLGAQKEGSLAAAPGVPGLECPQQNLGVPADRSHRLPQATPLSNAQFIMARTKGCCGQASTDRFVGKGRTAPAGRSRCNREEFPMENPAVPHQ